MLKNLVFATCCALAACASPVDNEPALQANGCYEGEDSVTTNSGEQMCVTRGYDDPTTARRGGSGAD